jgi:hypothetical protein
VKIIFFIAGFVLFFLPALQSQNAPVTTAGRITTAVPGNTYPIDVTVTGFTNIANFTLTIKFDTTRVHYVSGTTNPTLAGMTVTYTHPSGNTQGILVLSWSSAYNLSLANGSVLSTLSFSYVTGTGILSWAYILGSVCRYRSWVSGVLTTLNDEPKYIYYFKGGISNRTAPFTYAPTFTSVTPGALPVPVIVNGFTTIGAITLYLEYNPAIITYSGTFTKNAAFGGNFIVGDIDAGNGNRQIVIQNYGGNVTLANGSTLCTINFNYPSANCEFTALNWYDIGPSCEYADASGDVLIDMPQAVYYINGLVPVGLSNTWTGALSSAWDNAANWNACGIPDISRQAIIPDVSPNPFPVITGTASCKSIKILTGATLSVSPTGSVTVGNN